MAIKIITTEDGSQSLYNDEMNETYHSTKGARAESEYVFLRMGLDTYLQLREERSKQINILEIGFGTGLNAWLTWLWANSHQMPVSFYTLEPFPVPQVLIEQMSLFGDGHFRSLHLAPWNTKTVLDEHFAIEKSIAKLEDAIVHSSFDCIFFDAFAPSKQPEVWQLTNLKKCYDALVSGGILTTYCAQGQFKRNLAEAGFAVEVLPGALGKKEMIRGRKSI